MGQAFQYHVLVTAIKLAPDLTRCCLEGQGNYTLIDNAVKYKCQKAQLGKYALNKK
ncbi:MAG: hypothetical protein GX754_10640 [Clostridiaceae bacterium]|nr:hypothetical protein [Clostridiaceae bacterium]